MEMPGIPEHDLEQVLAGARSVGQKLASFLLRWDHYAEALPLLERLADNDPKGILYRAELAQCLLALGRVEEAAGTIELLLLDHPDAALAQAAQVDLLLARGNLPAAFDACQELLRGPTGERAVAWQKLAAYYLAAGKPADARACCERSEAIRRERAPGTDPSVALLRLLARVRAACGDAEGAAAVYARLAARRAEEAEAVTALLRDPPPARERRPRTRLPHSGSALTRAPNAAAASHPPLPAPTSAPTLDPAVPGLVAGVFGFQGFLPGQDETIARILAGQDVLAILPTGGGKSLCYQVAALRLPGAVVVISPLIALMRDQTQHLPPALARIATVINSSVESTEIEARLRCIAEGKLRLIYAAPERLRQWPFVHALRRAGVSLFVIDEAHCISLWGHDFRPDYFFIGPALDHLEQPRVLALTATAAPDVQAEIGARLGRSLQRVSAGIARPNLYLAVDRCWNDDEKEARLLDLVCAEEGPTIVYARSRQRCEELAALLRQHGAAAIYYHAGMDPTSRDEAQQAFMSGKSRVVCATVAFGMGIDKAGIRLIVHYNLPKSVENYWQEAGRAGRDGLPARCVLLDTAADRAILARWVTQDAVTIDLLAGLYRATRDLLAGRGPGRIVFDDLARAVEKEETGIRVALGLLERVGLIQRFADLPRTLTLCVRAPGDAAFQAFVASARLRPRQSVALDALDLCERTGIAAADLEPLLLEWRDAGWLEARSSGRDALLALPTPPAGARSQLEALLDTYQCRQDQRVAEMSHYARSRRCRHAFIARVFGEPPPERCRACDVCCPGGRPNPPGPPSLAPVPHSQPQGKGGTFAGTPAAPPASVPSPQPQGKGGSHAGGPAASPAPAPRRGPRACETRAGSLPPSGTEDAPSPALAVLRAVASLRAPLGARAVSRIVRGSASAPIGPDACPQFGALRECSRSAVTDLVKQLVRAGYLAAAPREEGGVLRLTPAGRLAVEVGRVPEEIPAAPSRPPRPPEPGGSDSPPGLGGWGAGEASALYERLCAWRRETAAAEGVPAFVVFHNRQLQSIAALRPRGLHEMRQVAGIGDRKCERYGAAVLALVAEHG